MLPTAAKLSKQMLLGARAAAKPRAHQGSGSVGQVRGTATASGYNGGWGEALKPFGPTALNIVGFAGAGAYISINANEYSKAVNQGVQTQVQALQAEINAVDKAAKAQLDALKAISDKLVTAEAKQAERGLIRWLFGWIW